MVQLAWFWPELQETTLPLYVGLGMGVVSTLVVALVEALKNI